MTNGWWRAGLAAALTIVSGAAGAATYANTATTFAWIDASGHAQVGYNTVPYQFNGTLGSSACGTAPPVIDDTVSDIVPLGFNFFYGDRSFDGVRIMSNGRLQFVSSSPVYDNTTCGYGSPVTQLPIPDAGLNYTMRIFGNDLDPTLKSDAAGYSTSCTSRTGANACFVSYATIGASPNRRFVATWNNVPEWAAASTTTGSYNIQIIVQEDGDFIYQFGADVPGPGATTGQVGWQVSTTDYEAPSVGYPVPNTAIRFFTPHPVLEYRMEESSWSGAGQVIDSSGGNRNGNPVGAVQTTAFGKVCRGADIPAAGNNAIDTATPVAGIGNAGMIAFWYKANTAWSGAGTQDVQLLDATTANNQWFFLVRRGGTGANAGKLRFVVTDSANNVRVAETPALAVAANTWKHVAVTWTFNNLTGGSNDRLRIYVDGALQATTSFTSTTLTLSSQLGTLYLGGSRSSLAGQGGSLNSADGVLDEFNVFNYEAPASKVSQVMTQVKTLCLNHFSVSHAGSAPTCLPPQVTVTAHALDHTAIAISGAVNLSTSTGTGTWSLLSGRGTLVGGAPDSGNATYQFISESRVILALTHPAGSMTAHATDGTYSDQENSALTITACGVGKFNACEPASPRCTPVAGTNTYGRLYTKLANTAFQLDLVALTGGGVLDGTFNKSVAVNLLANTNTPTLNSGTNCPTGQTATVSLGSVTFAGGRASVAAPWNAFGSASPNRIAYRDVRVQFVCSGGSCSPPTTVCAPDAFSVRPAQFAVTSNANADGTGANAAATPRIVAGAAFNLVADTSAPGYDGIPNFDGSKAEWLSPPAGGRAGGVGTVFGYFTTPSTIGTGNGATGTNFAYDEAGYFRLRGAGVYDTSYVAYSGDVGNGDCIAGSFANTADASGRIGCLIANTMPTSHFGRFIPHHFDESVTHGCHVGGFTYAAQPFGLRVTARNAANAATQNYSQSFAQALTLSEANGVTGGSIAPTSHAATVFTGGVANLTPAFTFTRTTPDHAPATIKPRAVDADGVSSAGGSEATTLVRIGRLRLSNVYGYASPLRMQVDAQYWTGQSWLRNADDACTALAANNLRMVPAGWGIAAPGGLAGGTGQIVLTPTGPGSVNVCADLGADHGVNCVATGAGMAWLQGKWPGAATFDNDPSAIATFGVFSPEGRKGVYNREMY